MKESSRDYDLALKVTRLSDDMLIGSAELAAFLGISRLSIQTGSVRLPERLAGLSKKMQWRLGDVKEFVRSQQTQQLPSSVATGKRGRGRPTKIEQVRQLNLSQQSELA